MMLYWQSVNLLVSPLILIDCICICAALTFSKRALHDYLTDSYVVYKDPETNVPADTEADKPA